MDVVETRYRGHVWHDESKNDGLDWVQQLPPPPPATVSHPTEINNNNNNKQTKQD